MDDGAVWYSRMVSMQLLLPNKDTRLTIHLNLEKVQELRVEMVRIQIGPSKGLLQVTTALAAC